MYHVCVRSTYCNGKLIKQITTNGPCSLGLTKDNDEEFNAILNQNQNVGGLNNGILPSFDINNSEHINNVTKIIDRALNQLETLNSRNLQIKSVIPNPFENSFAITIYSEGEQKITISLSNLLGKEIRNKTVFLVKEFNSIEFDDLKEVPNGVYIIKTTDAKGQIVSEKLIKQYSAPH